MALNSRLKKEGFTKPKINRLQGWSINSETFAFRKIFWSIPETILAVSGDIERMSETSV